MYTFLANTARRNDHLGFLWETGCIVGRQRFVLPVLYHGT